MTTDAPPTEVESARVSPPGLKSPYEDSQTAPGQRGPGGAIPMATPASAPPYAPPPAAGGYFSPPPGTFADTGGGSPLEPFWRDGRLVDPRVSDGDRTLASVMHLWWVFAFVGLGPLVALIPLIIWAVRQSSSGFVDDHGREIINAQLTMLILTIIPPLWPVLIVWVIVNGIGSIRAAIRANRREHYRYAMTFRPLG